MLLTEAVVAWSGENTLTMGKDPEYVTPTFIRSDATALSMVGTTKARSRADDRDGTQGRTQGSKRRVHP